MKKKTYIFKYLQKNNSLFVHRFWYCYTIKCKDIWNLLEAKDLVTCFHNVGVFILLAVVHYKPACKGFKYPGNVYYYCNSGFESNYGLNIWRWSYIKERTRTLDFASINKYYLFVI